VRRRHDPFLKLLYRAGARDVVTLFFPDTATRIDWRRLQWIEKEVPIPSRPARLVVADLVGLTQDVEGRYLQVLIHPELLRSGAYGEVNEMLQTEFGRRDERVRRETLQSALMEIMRSRFPAAPEDFEARVRRVKSVARLNELIRRAATVASVEDLDL
jgi:hypothetical protein